MIRRFYVHNFRCLVNFELPVSALPSVLLIGKNGAGKTTIGQALHVLQKIAHGTNRVGGIVRLPDLTSGGADGPMRFEIEAELAGKRYQYAIAFELPSGFRELRVLEEEFVVDGRPVYTRDLAQVSLSRAGHDSEAKFRIDWHLVALPIVQPQSPNDPLSVFREWLSRMLILRPIPALIRGESEEATLVPNIEVTDLAAWFSGLLAFAPSEYATIDQYLKQVMPDLVDVKNRPVGQSSRNLIIQFSKEERTLTVPFADLSDGEKCFMVCALVLAANRAYGPLLCFWDEPDNFLAAFEVGPSIVALRRSFQRSQLIVTSHNSETIRHFSDENTLVLYRNSHLEPTVVRPLQDLRANGELTGDLIDAITRGDVAA